MKVSDTGRHPSTGGLKKKISVALTEHALNRIESRFDVNDQEQIKRVLSEAATEGFVSSDEGGLLIEHDCLLATCNYDGNGTLTVMTVLDLTDGISRKKKEQIENARLTPWEDCEVIMPEDRSEELYPSPSPSSSVFSKTEPLGLSSSSKKIREWWLNNE